MKPEREFYKYFIREYIDSPYCERGSTIRVLLAEIDQLRSNLGVSKEAFKNILEFGDKAHADGSPESHSYNLGRCVATAFKTLAKITGEK